MAWATLQDVGDVTGHSVTTQELAMAEAAVTIYANRTPSASASIGARDLYWLQQATCWQACWLAEQVLVEGRSVVGSLTQDGMAVNYGAEWQVTLAPLAARSLKNLSWKAARSIDVPSTLQGVGVMRDFTLEASDDDTPWQELDGI